MTSYLNTTTTTTHHQVEKGVLPLLASHVPSDAVTQYGSVFETKKLCWRQQSSKEGGEDMTLNTSNLD